MGCHRMAYAASPIRYKHGCRVLQGVSVAMVMAGSAQCAPLLSRYSDSGG